MSISPPNPAYALCEHVGGHEFDVLCWSNDEEALEEFALEKEWARFRERRDQETIAIGRGDQYVPHPLSPDETGYRRYFVQTIPHVVAWKQAHD